MAEHFDVSLRPTVIHFAIRIVGIVDLIGMYLYYLDNGLDATRTFAGVSVEVGHYKDIYEALHIWEHKCHVRCLKAFVEADYRTGVELREGMYYQVPWYCGLVVGEACSWYQRTLCEYRRLWEEKRLRSTDLILGRTNWEPGFLHPI